VIKPWLKMIPVKWYIISLRWNDVISLQGLNCPIKYLFINGLDQSGCTLYFSWRQLWREHSLSSFLNEMAASARFFLASEDDNARFIEETRNKNTERKTNQDLELFKAFLRKQKVTVTSTGCVFTEIYSVCAKLNLLWTIISSCRRHRKISEEEKLQISYYLISWQCFACSFAVYVSLMITEWTLFAREEIIKIN